MGRGGVERCGEVGLRGGEGVEGETKRCGWVGLRGVEGWG